MLTRIRNAVRVERRFVDVPLSQLKRGVAEVLKREGYIWDFEEHQPEGEPSKQLRIELKYGPNGERVIDHVRCHQTSRHSCFGRWRPNRFTG